MDDIQIVNEKYIVQLRERVERKLGETGGICEPLEKALRGKRMPIENPRVVYQGEPGAYSEMAAIDFFGKDVNSEGLLHFEDTFKRLMDNTADYAVLPIENSSTGAIRQVYDLLAKYECYIVGETTVRVRHNLMVLPDADISDIKAVFSHEQGLFQCEEYLSEHSEWEKIPQADTAGSARMVAELKDKTKAAICSSRAAEIYGLKIIQKEINTNTNNTTRFVVISKKLELREGRDKICISFKTRHKAGALHEALTVFRIYGLNLVRLESRPIPEHNWEYMFFTEFTGDLLMEGMNTVVQALMCTVSDIRIFGNFKANLF
ncbi:prephenate dehydratase [Butyrivibrio sp. NC2002]|uniref:prephenate dehydratase n=1 Tax=Butyrivibrio sp. NC2002 TaxID=1410610 RepID=UPI00068BA1B4|nr:prephenate dehydratase [Butyrivibrio sp. NC2002]